MSLVRAQFALNFSKEMIIVLIACMALAALWAGFRPDMVRDNDGRRLPPSVTARLTFVVLFVVAYLGVTALVHFIPYVVSKMSTVAGFLANMIAKDSVPIYGLLVVFGLYSIPPFREVERSLLSWMHSTSHLRSDMQLLTNHLQECGFELTSEERRRNLHRLEELGIYVTDGDTSRINLESVDTWRKTTSLSAARARMECGGTARAHARGYERARRRRAGPRPQDRPRDGDHPHAPEHARERRLCSDAVCRDRHPRAKSRTAIAAASTNSKPRPRPNWRTPQARIAPFALAPQSCRST